ncbi:MAG: hypothetical protein LBI19_09945 [Oscillospiraceae bacterium]|jgi:spore germination protein KC|nr:hypothetical protein [Oscillospiraceae bacterium]
MRKYLAALLAFCFLPLSGCWDYKDLNKLSIVTGMAFDSAEDGKVKVTLEIVDRSSSPKKEGLRTRAVEVTGRDADEAVRKAAKGLDFELYFGAMAVAVFGKDTPYGDLRGWLLKNREVRETVYIVFAEEAGAMLHTEEDDGIAAYKLRDILDASKDAKPLELYKAGGDSHG